MKLKYYHINTFTENVFLGNPAKVVQLNQWLKDEVLQKIAMENIVDATAFFIAKDESIEIRWFTPDLELDLCGHATIAAAHVIMMYVYPESKIVDFNSNSGRIQVKKERQRYVMNLPQRKPIKTELPDFIRKSLNIEPIKALKSRDYILVYKNESDIKDIRIDRKIFDSENIDPGGVAITAKGNKVDFVSRFFVPQATIFEDSVTGSLHSSLVPYWSEILKKKDLLAVQMSPRGGKLYCTNLNDRVLISGNAFTYSEGVINMSTILNR